MDFIQLAKTRYSCRNFDIKPVEQEKLDLVLEAGRIAPSAANLQPWYFIVIKEKENLEKIWKVYSREWFRNAPCVIIICGNHSQSWKRKDRKDHCDIDIAITTDHMTLEAADLGLGTCWICNFDAELCTKLFNLPANLEPIVLLPLGYPIGTSDPDRHATQRKLLKDILSYETYT
jgi:nitroreductase